MSRPLAGRRVAVTGGSRGLGLAMLRQLVTDGAAVAFCARDTNAIAEAETTLTALSDRPVRGWVADVTDAPALETFAAEAERELGGLDGLVCNAGIWGPKGALDAIPWDAWMHVFDVNVHGVARTVRAFLPALRRSDGARIAILSGGGATKPMPFLAGYSATKTAVVRLGETLAEELRADGIAVNMIAPGAVNTRMLDEILAAGPALIGQRQYDDAIRQRDSGGSPPEKGAELCAYLFSEAAAGLTGKLISAIWDPWADFAAHADDLAGDVFTLRRIVPSDRGFSW